MLDPKYNPNPNPPFSFSTDQDPIRVAIYTRVSSDAQDVNNSIEAQISECKRYAARNKMVVVAIYVDEAESGTSDNRPQFQQMVSDGTSREKPFEVVLVWKFSRFSRSRVDNPIYKSRLKRRGVRIVSINEPTDDSPAGQFMEGIIEEVDAFYSANLGQEVRNGKRQLAERGYYPGSKAPYGYRLEKVQEEGGSAFHNILVKDPVTAPIVRRIFMETIAGHTLADIRRRFNREGVPPPEPKNKNEPKAKKWCHTTFGKIIRNLTYVGFIVWNLKSKDGSPPVIAQGRHENIVTPDEFKPAGEVVTSNAPNVTHPRRAGSFYMMSRLLRCRKCDKFLVVSLSKNQTYRSYQCSTRREDGADVCDCPRLDIARFEEKFLTVLLDDILCPSNIQTAVAKMTEELTHPYEEQRSHVQVIEAELLDVSQRKARVMEAYEKGAYTVDEYTDRVAPLRETESKLNQHLADATNEIEPQTAVLAKPEDILAFTTQVGEFIRHSPPKERKQMLQRFIKCVWVEPGKATVVYRVPLPRDAKRPEATDLVLALDEPVPPSGNVIQLQRNLKGVGGHVHPREQRRDVRIHVDVRPQCGGFAGGDQLVAGAGSGAVHGRLQVRLPVGQQARVGIARLPLLRRQHATHAGQVQRVHPLVLAERHPRPLARAAIPRQHRLPFAGPLLLGQISNRAAQAVQFLAQRRNVRVQPLPVKIAHLGDFILDGFQFPS